MKKLFLLSTVTLIGVFAFSQAKKEQNIKPAAAAEAAFKKAFPTASHVKWKSEDNDYEVVFKKDKTDMSAVYSGDGHLKETEQAINKSELPAAVGAYVKQHYKKDIKAAEKTVTDKGIITYEVEVGEVELIFDKDGKFINEEKEEKDED